MEQYNGRILEVSEVLLGSELDVDHASGTSTLSLYQVIDFNDRGGRLSIGGVVYAYSARDTVLDTLALTVPLTTSVTADTRVQVLPLSEIKEAIVQLEDGPPVRVRVPHSLYPTLDVGVRSDIGEAVVLDIDEGTGDWVIVDLISEPYKMSGEYIPHDTLLLSDGRLPAYSPLPRVSGGYRSLFVEWDPITNGYDKAYYRVHVSKTSPVALDASTQVAEVPGSLATITRTADKNPLEANTLYYVRIVAFDGDGSAPASAQASATTIEGITKGDWDAHQAAITQLNTDVTSNKASLNTLNNTTIPGLNSRLSTAEGSLSTLNNTTLPSLQETLNSTKSDTDTLKNTTVPNLRTDLIGAQGSINTLNNTTIPNLNAGLANANTIITGHQSTLDAQASALNNLNTTVIPGLNSNLASANAELSATKRATLDPYTREATGAGKWIYARFSGQSTGGAPTYDHILQSTTTSGVGFYADGTNPIPQNQADNYTGLMRAIVSPGATVTWTFSFLHDDGCTIYLDGKMVYQNAGYASSGTISIVIPAGSHLIDFLWNEQGGGDGLSNFSTPLSSIISNLTASASLNPNVGRTGAIATSLATAQSDISTLNTVTIPGLNSSLATERGRIDTLNTTTIPNLTASLATERSRIDTLNNTTLPGLSSTLSVANNNITALLSKFPIKALDVSFAVGGANLLADSSLEKDIRVPGGVPINEGRFSWSTDHRSGTRSAEVTVNAAYGQDEGSMSHYDGLWFSSDTNDGSQIDGKLPVTVSAYMKSSAGADRQFQCLIIPNIDGTTDYSRQTYLRPAVVSTGKWDRVSVTMPAYPDLNVTGCHFRFWMRSEAPSGSKYKLDDIQLEVGDVVTAYAPKPAEILPGSVGSTELAVGSVTTEKMVANTINGDRILAGTLYADRITAGSIGTNELGANSINGDRITTNTLYGDKITANSITGNQIAANSIAGDRITGRTIYGDRIVVNSLTGAEIAADSVSGDRIIARTLHASRLVAGSISTDEMTANSINGDRILAGTLSAAKIVAGSITGDRIAANAITTDKLTVASLGDNLVRNPRFLDIVNGAGSPTGGMFAAGWTFDDGNQTPYTEYGPFPGGVAMILPSTSGYSSVWSTRFPISAGRTYAISVLAGYAGERPGMYVRMQWETGAGAQVNFADLVYDYGLPNVSGPSIWGNQVSGQLTAPAGATHARIVIYNYHGKVNSYLAINEVSVKELVVSAQIGNGAINSDKILAGAVTTDKMTANTINGDRILANTLAAEKIVANSITGDRIAANTIGAERLTIATRTDSALPNGSLYDSLPGITTTDLNYIARGYQTSGNGAAYTVTEEGGRRYFTVYGDNSWFLSPAIPVSPGDEWEWSYDVYSRDSVGYGFYSYLNLYNDPSAVNDANGIYDGVTCVGPNAPTNGRMWENAPFYPGWNTYSGRVTVPEGFKYLKLRPHAWGNSSTVGGNIIRFGNFQLRRATKNVSISNGAITTDKMVANSINGDRILANTLDALKITAGSITTDRMMANSISGDRIAAGTLEASKIIAGSISTDRMTSNSINGDRITAFTLAASKLVAGSIQTGNMTANTIDGGVITANTLNASKIVAGSISTDRMTANSISGDRIAAGTLNADKIVAGSISTAQMTANTINGDRITAGTLNANKIVAGTISATQLAADAITVDLLTANNVIAQALNVADLSVVDLNAVRVRSGTISIGPSTASSSSSQAFSGTALPSGWAAVPGSTSSQQPSPTVVTNAPSGVSGSALKMAIVAGQTSGFTGTSQWDVTTDQSVGDWDVTVKYYMENVSSSSTSHAYNTFRMVLGGDNRFRFELDFDNYNENVVIYSVDTANSIVGDSQLPVYFSSTGLQTGVAAWRWVRAVKKGNQLFLKVWMNGSSEPAAWTKSTTTNFIGYGGRIDFESRSGVYSTNYPTQAQAVYFDQVNVQSIPSAFVVNQDGTGDWPAFAGRMKNLDAACFKRLSASESYAGGDVNKGQVMPGLSFTLPVTGEPGEVFVVQFTADIAIGSNASTSGTIDITPYVTYGSISGTQTLSARGQGVRGTYQQTWYITPTPGYTTVSLNFRSGRSDSTGSATISSTGTNCLVTRKVLASW